MLSIAKINSAAHQIASGSADGNGYLHYLGGRTTPNRSDFDDYARGDQVERLAKGLHPIAFK